MESESKARSALQRCPSRLPAIAGCAAISLLLAAASPILAQEQPEEAPPPSATVEVADQDPPELRGKPVVVESAGKREQEVHRLPDAIGLVDRETIARRVPTDLGDTLRGVPGVYIQRTAGGQASPFVRGMTGKQLLLLVDGVRFSNAAFRSGPNQYFGVIDPYFAERVEVVRGPYSVLYGSDALSGAVNVISRKPLLSETGVFRPAFLGQYASASRSSRGTVDAPFSLPGRLLGGYASASVGDHGNIVAGPGIGVQPFTSYRDWSGTAGLTWALSDNWSFDFRGMHRAQTDLYRTDRMSTVVANPGALPLDGSGNPRGVEDLQLFPAQTDSLALATLRHRSTGVMELLQIGLSWHRVDEEFHRIQRNSTTRREQFFTDTTIGVQAMTVLNFGPLSKVTAGFDFYHDDIDAGRTDVDINTGVATPNNGRAQFPGGSEYTSMGIYVQDEILLAGGAIEIRPGLRASFYQAKANVSEFSPTLPDVNESFGDLTGALAMVWHATDWLSPNLSIGRGFRAPNLDDLAASKNTGNGDEIPNPNLDPEVLWGIQAGTKIQVDNYDPNWDAPYRFRAEAFIFGHWMEDAVLRRPVVFNGNNVFQLENAGRARIWGWEIGFSWYPGAELDAMGIDSSIFDNGHGLVSVHGSATWNHGDDLTANEPFPRIQPFIGTLGVRYETEDWYIEPSVEYWARSDRQSPNNANDPRFAQPWTPGFTLFHVEAGWKWGEHVTTKLAVNNIGNKTYQTQGNGVFGSGTDARVSMEVRW